MCSVHVPATCVWTFCAAFWPGLTPLSASLSLQDVMIDRADNTANTLEGFLIVLFSSSVVC
ncbi:UNVERIFIED_CONTAM: hypothetical protein FKN15_047815 [Acipenser sinensis]